MKAGPETRVLIHEHAEKVIVFPLIGLHARDASEVSLPRLVLRSNESHLWNRIWKDFTEYISNPSLRDC